MMYTANLTANLTVSNMKKPIDSLESLLSQVRNTLITFHLSAYVNYDKSNFDTFSPQFEILIVAENAMKQLLIRHFL